jgi:hypothetical protein
MWTLDKSRDKVTLENRPIIHKSINKFNTINEDHLYSVENIIPKKEKNISKFYKGLIQVNNDPVSEKLMNYS